MKTLTKLKNRLEKSEIIYIVDRATWAAYWVGKYITQNLNSRTAKIDTETIGYQNKLIHLGCFGQLKRIVQSHSSNKIILTIFHLEPDDKRLDSLRNNLSRIEKIHTSNKRTKKELMDLGIPEKKIVVIPLGVDLELFTPAQEDDKIKIRQKLGLPEDKTIIGSFQKDGVGWEDGLEPKLVKGPDIFCDAVEQLARDHKIHVLLTGPARGYVKKRLDQASISYSHFNLENYRQIPDYYRALDIYLITSRVEGGPLALFEAWASGIPLVSTKVGLVPDLATDGKNILLSDIDDVSAIAKQANRLISNQNLKKNITAQALEEVKKYSWQTIAAQYYKYLYSDAD